MVKIDYLDYIPSNAKRTTNNWVPYDSTMHFYMPYADLRRAKMDAYSLLKQGKVLDAHKYSPKFFEKGYHYVNLKTSGRDEAKTYAIVAMYNGRIYYECQTSSRPTVFEIDALGNNIRKVKNIYKGV